MPTLSIRKVPQDQIDKLKKIAKERGVRYNSVEELLRQEIAQLTQAEVEGANLPITLYHTPALPLHYVAVKDDGSKWIILATVVGPKAWENASTYKGNYELEKLPDYITRMYLPNN